MTPTEADIEAVVEADDKGTRLYPEQVVDGLPTIYSFQSCPFCFKIRALLGSRGIAYADVEVEPMITESFSDSPSMKQFLSILSDDK